MTDCSLKVHIIDLTQFLLHSGFQKVVENYEWIAGYRGTGKAEQPGARQHREDSKCLSHLFIVCLRICILVIMYLTVVLKYYHTIVHPYYLNFRICSFTVREDIFRVIVPPCFRMCRESLDSCLVFFRPFFIVDVFLFLCWCPGHGIFVMLCFTELHDS